MIQELTGGGGGAPGFGGGGGGGGAGPSVGFFLDHHLISLFLL